MRTQTRTDQNFTPLADQIARGEQAQAELREQHRLADSLPALRRQQQREEDKERAERMLSSAVDRVAKVLDAQGDNLSGVRERVMHIAEEVRELAAIMKITQKNISGAGVDLGHAINASVGLKYKRDLSSTNHVTSTKASVDFANDLMRNWSRLWAQAGGTSWRLIAFSGRQEDRLNFDLIQLLMTHSQTTQYQPENPSTAMPFGW